MIRRNAHWAAMRTAAALVAIVLLCSLIPAATAAAADLTCSQYGNWNGAWTTQVCYNHPLNTANANITMAIITVFPGDNRASGVWSAVVDTGRADQVLVMAPSFPESAQADPNALVWYGDWRFGGYSINDGVGVSSFEVVDRLIEEVAANRALFPNLSKIVVTGFSAGGQLATRYALANSAQIRVYNNLGNGIQFRYVVGSPSIYAYLDETRWNSASGRFEVPADTSFCPWYNSYPYGIDVLSLDGYPLPDQETMRTQTAQRQVIYLVGQQDNIPNDSGLTVDCASNLQGATRLERARRYYAHIQKFYGALAMNHSLVEVPGVGHSTGVYTSSQGRAALFENWPATYSISGTVTDNMGLPFSNIPVNTSAGFVNTSSSGAYAFSGLLPGSYKLNVSGAVRTVQVPPSAAGQDIHVTPDLMIHPNRGKPGSAFNVYASGPGCSPGAVIDVSINKTKIGSITCDANGGLTVSLQTTAAMQPGSYLVVLDAQYPSAAVIYVLPDATLIPPTSGYPVLNVPDTVEPGPQIFVPLISR